MIRVAGRRSPAREEVCALLEGRRVQDKDMAPSDGQLQPRDEQDSAPLGEQEEVGVDKSRGDGW